MRPLILTDLDDTLFQTARKCPEDMGEAKVMSYLNDGSVSGLASERQTRFAAWLRMGTLVPVTARSREVLARVEIEQSPAICANGGCIITRTGEVDQDWHRLLVTRSIEIQPISMIYRLVTEGLSAQTYRHWIVSEGDLELYFVIKTNGEDLSVLDGAEELAEMHVPPGWRIHRNGNNLAVLPGWLNKRHAAAYFIALYRASNPYLPVIGIGDSHSDVGFMDLCDFAITPTNSQVWSLVKKGNVWCQ